MALPPIIANNPIMKLFRSEPPKQKGPGGESVPLSTSSRDTVEISEAARKKFGELQLKADKQARAAAEDTRGILSRDQKLTLGIDPDFAD